MLSCREANFAHGGAKSRGRRRHAMRTGVHAAALGRIGSRYRDPVERDAKTSRRGANAHREPWNAVGEIAGEDARVGARLRKRRWLVGPGLLTQYLESRGAG